MKYYRIGMWLLVAWWVFTGGLEFAHNITHWWYALFIACWIALTLQWMKIAYRW